ncbi:HAD-IIB family hydrolase [Sphingomonas sp. R-74633]|uniref:HAD-IIB family hydrolase n=1 Tax=Sphingomonas sp. R-74633 TaxID=2751188 RepID=UPI0015D2E074|nr:HAD-IIB family hydrolase [Sphingomonas sp. R-74633]NYT40733.1 HAD-IIB family hydrolase [Sphingomonas sp. R-74633]
MKRLVAFDLDGTLAESKQSIAPDMAAALAKLLQVADVAVISGAGWPQYERQIVEKLEPGARLGGLWLMPTTGTKLYRFDDGWHQIYADNFSDADKAKIRAAFDQALADTSTALPTTQIWGERLEDRGSQFTFSALGQQAPLEAKEKWDPDRTKRAALQAQLQHLLPDLSIRLGGTTSIDVTRPGTDKAHALRRLSQESHIPIHEMIFIGDALYAGGNDAPAKGTGIDTIQVRDPAETLTAIAAIVACLTTIRAHQAQVPRPIQ